MRPSNWPSSMLERFRDPAGGGFFFTASDHEQLISRTKDLFDNATPSGNALAATALVRLGKLTGRNDFLVAAQETFQAAAAVIEQSPTAAGQMLLALDMYLGPTSEMVILAENGSPDLRNILQDLRRRYLPNKVVAVRPGPFTHRSAALDPLFAGKSTQPGEPTLFICQEFACQAPLVGAAAIKQAVDRMPAGGA